MSGMNLAVGNGNRIISYGDLRVTLTYFFIPVWSDSGSGAARNGTLWHLIIEDDGMRPLGSVVIGNDNNIVGQWAVFLVGDDPANRKPGQDRLSVKAPIDYEMVWNDEDTGATMDGSVWRPCAPDGYVALGDVASHGHGKPSLDKVWCLRSDLVADGAVQVADEKNQRHDASFWDVFPRGGNSSSEHIPVLAGTSLTVSGYGLPAEALKVPALYMPKVARPFFPRPPEIPAGGWVPDVRELFDEMEQNAITLPFTSFFEPNDQASLRHIRGPPSAHTYVYVTVPELSES
ncbi:hypothetical protein N657DRAFT_682747 [Parathielavia appendiculata]|uniref:DUF946 domain-containing protein n=1 Tax=Parathielavia appendiculata TaxID=2587402 RepID=A0AAN6TW20_9PEZI|nr:hypothetical protein N657DRAFT_682747 [Parathielavia appendiculata]